MSPAACFSRHCRKRLSRSGLFRTQGGPSCFRTELAEHGLWNFDYLPAVEVAIEYLTCLQALRL
jgi:hypothetical protein